MGRDSIEVELSKSDGSEWTDEEVESLYMIADGVLLTTYSGSSVDFMDGNRIVASIPRDYHGRTIARLLCSAGSFGTLYEYAVSYLGWEEPSMPSVVVIPSLPQSVSGGGRTLYLRKGDGSNWTETDVNDLAIKVDNNTCEVVATETGFDYSINGTVYCSITGSLVTDQKIPILCHGTSEGQPLNYTITSIEIVEPVTIVTSPALPISVTMGPGSSVNLSKSDGSEFTEQDITGLKVTANGTLCEISWREQPQQWAVTLGSNTISYIRTSVIGQTAFEMTLAGSAAYTVESIELG